MNISAGEGCHHMIVLGVGYSGTSTISQEMLDLGWKMLKKVSPILGPV